MTLFTIPTFSRRPSFASPFAQPTNFISERPLEEKSFNVAARPLAKVKISGPRVLNSAPASPIVRQIPAQLKRPLPRRVTRSQSRSRLMVPHKATATQTLTLTSATSFSSQAKDIEDVDINTISFPPPIASGSRSVLKFKSSAPPRRPSPTPPPSKTHHRSSPPQPGMGRGPSFVAPSPTRAGNPPNNPRIRSSTSPPSAGTPPIHKRARLTSLSRSPKIPLENREIEMNIPARPESPTPGSRPSSGFTPPTKHVEVIRRKPTPFRPPTSVPAPLHTKKLWDTISRPNFSSPHHVLGEDDDDDIIVLKMDVEKPPALALRVVDVDMKDADACNTPLGVDTLDSDTGLNQYDEPMLEDLRDEMLKLSMILAKRVRKRMNPSLSDDVPPPIPSPVKLRQAIAMMFLEHSNSFPPLRRRSPPPGLGGAGKQRSRLDVVDFFPEEGRLGV